MLRPALLEGIWVLVLLPGSTAGLLGGVLALQAGLSAWQGSGDSVRAQPRQYFVLCRSLSPDRVITSFIQDATGRRRPCGIHSS